jgi:hypothetical protein
MYAVYGSYTHTVNEVNLLSFQQRLKYSARGKAESTVKTVTLEAVLIPSSASQANITTAIRQIELAYSVNGLSWGLYQDDGTITPHALPLGSISGVRVMGFDWNKSDGAEYATQRTATITLEAEYPGGDNLLIFQETLRFIGNGGARFVWVETANGPPQRQLVNQRTVARAVQSGMAVGLLAEPDFPPPIWPNIERYDLREMGRVAPRFDGAAFRDWGINWTYQFESGQPLFGEPHRR